MNNLQSQLNKKLFLSIHLLSVQTTVHCGWWEDDPSLRGEWRSFMLDAGGHFALLNLTTARHRLASIQINNTI